MALISIVQEPLGEYTWQIIEVKPTTTKKTGDQMLEVLIVSIAGPEIGLRRTDYWVNSLPAGRFFRRKVGAVTPPLADPAHFDTDDLVGRTFNASLVEGEEWQGIPQVQLADYKPATTPSTAPAADVLFTAPAALAPQAAQEDPQTGGSEALDLFTTQVPDQPDQLSDPTLAAYNAAVSGTPAGKVDTSIVPVETKATPDGQVGTIDMSGIPF